MKFFIDSADYGVIRTLIRVGVFSGVTTNPTILKASKITKSDFHALAKSVIALGAREVFFQSWGNNADALVENGRFLFNDDPQIVVKVPCTREGIEASARLSREGIKTCVTAVFSAHQVLLAAAAGAAYVAPYLGRMNDAGRDGHGLIAQMADALQKSGGKTQILAASIRDLDDIVKLAQASVRCVTLSPTIAGELFDDSLTLESTARFEADAAGLAR